MGITIGHTRVSCNTSTGNQAITVDVGGLTPKAARFILVAATTDGTAANDCLLSHGAASGTSNRWVLGYYSDHGLSASAVYGWVDNDEVIQGYDDGGTLLFEADIVSFGTDTVTINWSNAPSSAWLLTVIAYAGSDLSAHANSFDIANTQDNTVDITDPGFEPDVIIMGGYINGTSIPRATGLSEITFGYCHNDGASGITQRCVYWFEEDNKATSEVGGRCTAIYTGMEGVRGTAAIDFGVDLHTFDSNGFSASARNAGGNARDFVYLALSMGGAVSTAVGTYSTPTSTGSDSDTGPGFTPQHVDLIMTHMEAVDTAYTSALGGARGFASWLSGSQYANSANSEDNVGTTNTQSLSDNTAIELPDDDGSTGLTASFTSFDANGWTLNYSAVEANAKLFFYLAIESDSSGYSIDLDPGSYSVTGQDPDVLANRQVDLDPGSYSVTGQDPDVLANRQVDLDPGSYSVTGQDATLLISRLLDLDPGSYTIAGRDATLSYSAAGGYSIDLDPGSYTLTGQDVDLLINRVLDFETGVYSVTGLEAEILRNAVIDLDAGSYTITGQDADLLVSRLIELNGDKFVVGNYVVTGQDAELVINRMLDLDAGSYTVTGQDTGLDYSGQVDPVTPLARISVIVLENRVYVISEDNRTYAISGESRVKPIL